MKRNTDDQAPLVVTLGEPGGIGPELVLDLWLNRSNNHCPAFVYLANQAFVQARARTLGIEIPVSEWCPNSAPDAIEPIFERSLPMLSISENISNEIGKSDSANAEATIHSIKTAVQLIKGNKASALVTSPINKKSLYDVGFSHPGHTEFLGELAADWLKKPVRTIMMLAGPELRTVPATLHIPLSDVPDALRDTDLVELFKITHDCLKQQFGIQHPRIAVAGLNPHAGEEGSMGHEDETIIRPAIERALAMGLDVGGPFPGDTLFYAERRETYDVVIAMYHDQALIPVKTIAFDETVNVTLGLPFIRTSPDHGTAFDIAGKGIAKPDSMLAAIKLARYMVDRSNTNHHSYDD